MEVHDVLAICKLQDGRRAWSGGHGGLRGANNEFNETHYCLRTVYDRSSGKRSKENTLKDYARILQPFVARCKTKKGVTKSHALDKHLIREYVVWLRTTIRSRGKSWAPGTVNIHIRTLRSFLGWLKREKATKSNLAQVLETPQAVIREEDLLTNQELEVLFSACTQEPFAARDRALLLTFLDTVLRLSEIAELTRQCFHFGDQGKTAWFTVRMSKTGKDCFAFSGQVATQTLRPKRPASGWGNVALYKNVASMMPSSAEPLRQAWTHSELILRPCEKFSAHGGLRRGVGVKSCKTTTCCGLFHSRSLRLAGQ